MGVARHVFSGVWLFGWSLCMNISKRLLQRILSRRSDANIRFDDLRGLLRNLGFAERISGSHHIFRKQGVVERLNLQRDNGQAKPYQVRQVRRVILKYKLEEDI